MPRSAFADRLTGRVTTNRSPLRPVTAGLLGVEHEFRLRDARGPVDFRDLIHRLPIDGARLDPSDPNAYRCRWGGALTCDAAEAEIASPPVALAPGFTGVLDECTRFGRHELAGLVGHHGILDGYSTHVNVAIANGSGDREARVFVRRFAPALMLLMDRVSSPGLLVRPRPGRLEFGGDYVSGLHLRAVSAFAAGSVRAIGDSRELPPRVHGRAVPAVERFGTYVDRSAFGDDLYRQGRATMLRRFGGGTITAQEHLEVACGRGPVRDRARRFG